MIQFCLRLFKGKILTFFGGFTKHQNKPNKKIIWKFSIHHAREWTYVTKTKIDIYQLLKIAELKLSCPNLVEKYFPSKSEIRSSKGGNSTILQPSLVYTTIEKTYFDLLVERFAVARPWHCGEGGTESLLDHIPLLPSKKKIFRQRKFTNSAE